jgi:hypothetical protein
MIKLSSIQYGILCYDWAIVTIQDVKEKVKRGEIIEDLCTVTPEWTEAILKKAYDEYQQGKCSEYLSAPNKGERIKIDI